MKARMKGRATLRGKPLKWFCKSATVSKGEFGNEDTRCLCLGLIDIRTDEVFDECIKCGAYFANATPPKEEDDD